MGNKAIKSDPLMYQGKIVLVTGSSKGIGRAIARGFGLAGAHIILNGNRDGDALSATYADFKQSGISCCYFLGNLGDLSVATNLFDSLPQLIPASYSTSTGIDILINNAGISHVGLFQDTSPAIWQSVLTANLQTAYHCSYFTVPHMIRQQSGVIINISSIWGSVGASCEVAYATSKSALDGFTRALAKELGPSHIRVNAIACGWIDTSMNSHFSAEEKEAFVQEVPLGRTGTPEEVADLCLYLASDQASYLTGQVVPLDGGLL